MKVYSNIKLREALSNNFRMLLIFGYWPPENSTKFTKFLYIIYGTLFVGFVFLTYTFTEIVNIIFSMGDMEQVINASFLFLTHMAQVIKLCYFIVYNSRMKKLIDSLDRDIFKPKSAYHHELIENCIYESKLVYNVFAVMCLATCCLWGVFPVIDKGEELALPLSAYYPFSTKESPIFEIVFIYQIVSTSINAITNISIDTMVSGLMALMGTQLDMLNDTFVNMRSFAEEALKDKGIVVKQNEFELLDVELQAEMDRLLVHCVDHHRNILQITDELGDVFSICVLSQFAAGAIIICLTMFELTLAPLLSIKFVSMVLYQGCMLVEIIVYCWYGNEVILKSTKLTDSAYFSDWTSCTISFKKNLLFVMTRTRNPIKLYAGNFFTLSLETLVNILRSSWSYFAVLNRKHQD